MFFVGDVHGNFNRYHKFCKKFPESLQLGDMGVGFPDNTRLDGEKSKPKSFNSKHKFFCGNHDDYKYASQFSTCLKRYGYLEEQDIFYISGGYSIDKQFRVPGDTWWEYEQLDMNEMIDCMSLYRKTKPSIVCSHEAPAIAKYWALFYSNSRLKKTVFSSTENFLTEIYDTYAPKYWIHGHFHQFYTKKEGNTLFVGLDELLYGEKQNCIYEL